MDGPASALNAQRLSVEVVIAASAELIGSSGCGCGSVGIRELENGIARPGVECKLVFFGIGVVSACELHQMNILEGNSGDVRQNRSLAVIKKLSFGIAFAECIRRNGCDIPQILDLNLASKVGPALNLRDTGIQKVWSWTFAVLERMGTYHRKFG